MVSIISMNLNKTELPASKGLPWCTAGYETWFTGATLIEIGVCALVVFVSEIERVFISWACRIVTVASFIYLDGYSMEFHFGAVNTLGLNCECNKEFQTVSEIWSFERF